ncbi:MAG: efflux RND transporter periplasmic adaptor subunit [Micromonosporaceae bacterium]|nr:efflux RND transporter periplasmic adaptor subunit [Micromonosporaceae bacterium]
MRSRLAIGGLAALALALGGCSGDGEETRNPGLDERGTISTTVTPTRQDLTDRMSLAGKVVINPVFGLVAPTDGEVHFYDIPWPRSTPTEPVWAANVWLNGNKTRVDIPAGATFAGRLVPDYSTVTQGMPIVSARWMGYGVVADIQPADAYRVSDNLTTVRVQIANGPGPFDCSVLGTIAALPAGTIPEPQPFIPDPNDPPEVQEQKRAQYERAAADAAPYRPVPSEATGMRVVCIPPDGVRLINGADATVEVITASATNALVLPVAAVAGRQGTGKVTVVLPDGSTEIRDVVLGLTDGEFIEIKEGLTGDETIAVPGPNLPDAPQQGGKEVPPGPVIVR